MCGLSTQVILTAIHWVELPDNEVVVCERIEDIDRYVIDDTSAFREPTYEQVKTPSLVKGRCAWTAVTSKGAVITVLGVPNG